jgi:F-type H+-transporting ATPase subunit b
MLIDWFTVAAQLLNFLILVWLMKRFLYQPILAAIAARELAIATQLADAAQQQQQAQQLNATLAERSARFDEQRAALLTQASAEAQAERQRQLDLGRSADIALRQRSEQAVRAEQQKLAGAVTLQARDEVLAVARRALAELADDTMEDGMLRLFLRHLAALDAAACSQLTAALAAAPDTAVLRSTLPLNTEQQAALTLALQQTLQGDGPSAAALHFDSAPELLCGIEFSVNGWKLAWTIDDYLHGLERRVNALLVPAPTIAKPATKTAAAPETALSASLTTPAPPPSMPASGATMPSTRAPA